MLNSSLHHRESGRRAAETGAMKVLFGEFMQGALKQHIKSLPFSYASSSVNSLVPPSLTADPHRQSN